MTDRIVTPIIAIGLASLVWLYTRSRDQEVLDNYPVPVEIQLASPQADMYELEVAGPCQIPVSFAGPFSRIREFRSMLQRGNVRIQRTVSVPDERLADARYVDVIRLDASEVPALPGVQAIIAENQNRIPITLRRIVEKELPVRVNHTGDDQVELKLLEPKKVMVRGPKEILDRQDAISTQLYRVPKPTKTTEPRSVEGRVSLVAEFEGRPVRVTPSEVAINLTVKPKQKIYELTDVPVHFLCPVNFAYRPQFRTDREGKVTLRVLGPGAEERPAVSAYVDLTARKFGQGIQPEEPIRVQLPPGFQLDPESPPPRLPSFELVPLTTTPTKPSGTALGP